MEGINTAIVGYILLCMVMPHLIKNRTQYYMALAAVLVNILLMSLALMIGSTTLLRAIQCIGLLLTAASLVLLVLASGGLSFREFTTQMGGAINETFRSQEPERTPIIPITGEQPKTPDEPEESHERHEINDPGKP
jgi:hypothetical protein